MKLRRRFRKILDHIFLKDAGSFEKKIVFEKILYHLKQKLEQAFFEIY